MSGVFCLKAARWTLFFTLSSMLAGCVTAPQPCLSNEPEAVYVIDQGWHTELAVPANVLRGRAAWFKTVFPGANVVLFGYGKRTFITAPADDFSEYLLGPFPGPAVIQLAALNVLPDQAYQPKTVRRIALSPAQMDVLTTSLWRSFTLGRLGLPRLMAVGEGRRSLFYAARRNYGPLHTCNTWTAEILHAAIPEIEPSGVILAGQVMRAVGSVTAPLCRPASMDHDEPIP